MIAAALALASVAAPVAASPAPAAQDVGHLRTMVELRGRPLSHAFADEDGDGDVDLLVAVVREDGARAIDVYRQHGRVVFEATPGRSLAMPRAVVCWAVGEFLDGDGEAGAEVIVFARDAVHVRSHSGRFRLLHEARMLLDIPSGQAMPRWRPVADVDGDGLDEIVIATTGGFRVLGADGGVRGEIPLTPVSGRTPTAAREFFGGAVRATLTSEELSDLFVPNEEVGVIEPPPALFSEVSLPLPQWVDADGDGRADLTYVRDNELFIHYQDAEGGFPDEAGVALELPEEGGYSNFRLLWTDAGGGPAADLLLTRTNREGINLSPDWQARIWVDPAPGGALGTPDKSYKSRADYLGAFAVDLDGDGRVDVGLSSWTLEIGVLGQMDTRLRHKVSGFLRADDGSFATRPAFSYERDYAVDDLDAFRDVRSIVPDLTGDGRANLLESTTSGVLEARAFRDSGSGLDVSGEPVMRVPVDAFAATVDVADVNGDGIGDFFIRHADRWEFFLSYRR